MKKRMMKKEIDNLADWLGQQVTSFYILVMCVFFPVFYTNKMFSLTWDKKHFFFIFYIYLYMFFISGFWKENLGFPKGKIVHQKSGYYFCPDTVIISFPVHGSCLRQEGSFLGDVQQNPVRHMFFGFYTDLFWHPVLRYI